MPAALAELGVDVPVALRERTLVMLTPEALYAPTGGPGSLLAQALAAGFTGVRMAAEAAAALSVLSPEGYAALEDDFERITATGPASVLCQYSRAGATGAQLDLAIARHPRGVRERQLAVSSGEGVLELDGEVDVDNAEILAAAVGMASCAADSGTVRVDLGRLSFLDVGGVRGLVQASQPFRDSGGKLLLLAPQPVVGRLLSLLDVDRCGGVEVRGGTS